MTAKQLRKEFWRKSSDMDKLCEEYISIRLALATAMDVFSFMDSLNPKSKSKKIDK